MNDATRSSEVWGVLTMLVNKRQVFLYACWNSCSLARGWQAGAWRWFGANTRCSAGVRGEAAVEDAQKADWMSEDAAEPVQWVVPPYRGA